MLTVHGEPWPFGENARTRCCTKPAGYECSAGEPKHWPSVYELLPVPLRQRPTKSAVNGVQAVGGSDQDTRAADPPDDGQFISSHGIAETPRAQGAAR